MTITISVIICTHDRPEGLRRVVQSVLSQSRPAREIIVVNDGREKTDPQLVTIAALVHVSLVRLKSSRPSLPQSRNMGIDAATGDIVLLLDDDVVLPNDYLARLTQMYEADAENQVAAIGGRMVRTQPLSRAEIAWQAIADSFASNRWGPRACRARYIELPVELRGRLTPARCLSGGAISVRRAAARVCRFEEAFEGYALGEDLDFAFRLTRRAAVFVAAELEVAHECGSGGRPDEALRGRMYVRNMIHIARNSTEADVGTWTLLAYHFMGMILLGVVWSALSGRRRNLTLAAGMARELWSRAAGCARRMLCGC